MISPVERLSPEGVDHHVRSDLARVGMQYAARDGAGFPEGDPAPRGMDANIDPTSPETLTRSSVDYLRAHRDELAQGGRAYETAHTRYTEIHSLDGRPVVLVAPRPSVGGGASIIGVHSILDEIRHNQQTEAYPRLMAFADDEEHHLDTETVVGKGYTTFDEQGRALLTVRNIRGGDGLVTPAWAAELNNKVGELGYDAGLMYAPRFNEAPRPVAQNVLNDTHIDLQSVPSKKLLDNAQRSDHLHQGVVNKITVDPMVLRKRPLGDDYQPYRKMHIKGYDAPVKTHGPVLDALELEDPYVMQEVEWGNDIIVVGVRYTLDTQAGPSINFYFGADYGGKESELEQVIATSLGNNLLQYQSIRNNTVKVTVAVPDSESTPRIYMLDLSH